MDNPCFFCGGAAHPATGHAYNERVLSCRRCTLEMVRYVCGWSQRNAPRRKRKDGTRPPETALSFYEAAVLFRTEPR